MDSNNTLLQLTYLFPGNYLFTDRFLAFNWELLAGIEVPLENQHEVYEGEELDTATLTVARELFFSTTLGNTWRTARKV